jgi:hypothetical protein
MSWAASTRGIIVDNDQPRPAPGGYRSLFPPDATRNNGDWFPYPVFHRPLNWTALCTNSVTDGAIHFVDPEADETTQRSIVPRRQSCPLMSEGGGRTQRRRKWVGDV